MTTPAVAYQRKDEVNSEFVRLARILLDSGTYPAIATHDEDALQQVRAYADSGQMARDRYEFQMLYGIRRDRQLALVESGYRMRVYVPFGREWFPYFMRRLGERPANLSFVLKSLIREG